MRLSEKVFIAKQKWNCEFDSIAFLLDLDPKDIELMYLDELRERFVKKPIKESDGVNRLGLSNRSINALHKAKIKTVKELLENISSISKKRGFGLKTKSEIENALKAADFNV